MFNDHDIKKYERDHTCFNAKVTGHFDGGIIKVKYERSSTDGEVPVDVERSI